MHTKRAYELGWHLRMSKAALDLNNIWEQAKPYLGGAGVGAGIGGLLGLLGGDTEEDSEGKKKKNRSSVLMNMLLGGGLGAGGVGAYKLLQKYLADQEAAGKNWWGEELSQQDDSEAPTLDASLAAGTDDIDEASMSRAQND